MTPVLLWLLSAEIVAGDAALAGGVHHVPRSLPEIAGQTGLAALVKPQQRKDGRLTAKVLACFTARPGRCTVGKSQSFELFQMPRLNAEEWIAITRYWNSCDACLSRGSASLILIEAGGFFEPLQDNPQNRRLAKIVGRADWKKHYVRKTALAQLRKDLADPDLFKLAHGELLKKGSLSDKALFAAARRIDKPRGADSFNLLLHHYKSLRGAARTRFFDSLVGAVQGGERHARVLQALAQIVVKLQPSDLGRAARLAAALSFKVRAEQALFSQLVYQAARLLRSSKSLAAHREQIARFCRFVLADKELSTRYIANECKKRLAR